MTRSAHALSGAPELILIIRHGEKPVNEPSSHPASVSATVGVDIDGNPDSHSLTPRGWQRSGALAVLFTPASGPLRAGLRTPTNLFSPNYNNLAKISTHRTYQTIQALSHRIKVPIETSYQEGEENDLIDTVLSTTDQTVLICWDHHHIPALATAIPTPPGTAIPLTWPGTRFDLIWCFTRTPGTAQLYTFTQVPQRLLNGDTDTIIT